MKLDPKIGRSLKKASPTILTCIGAAGVVATAVLAVKATPKADMTEIRRHDADSDEYKRAFILDFNVVGDITSKIVDHQNDYLA